MQVDNLYERALQNRRSRRFRQKLFFWEGTAMPGNLLLNYPALRLLIMTF